MFMDERQNPPKLTISKQIGQFHKIPVPIPKGNLIGHILLLGILFKIVLNVLSNLVFHIYFESLATLNTHTHNLVHTRTHTVCCQIAVCAS